MRVISLKRKGYFQLGVQRGKVRLGVIVFRVREWAFGVERERERLWVMGLERKFVGSRFRERERERLGCRGLDR